MYIDLYRHICCILNDRISFSQNNTSGSNNLLFHKICEEIEKIETEEYKLMFKNCIMAKTKAIMLIS